jgi:hypothetical protein
MTVMFVRSSASLLSRTLALALLTTIIVAVKPAPAADLIKVAIDRAQVMKLPTGVATIVIGNPLIADVSIQTGGLLILTGKGYGMTNFLVFDRSGAVLMDATISVESPTEAVVVYRGIERESYSCAPQCERRITLGDSPAFFDTLVGQAGTRVGQAQGGTGQSVQR